MRSVYQIESVNELPRDVQLNLISCLDCDGCPADADAINAILREFAPRLAGIEEAERVFDQLHELYWLNRLALVAGSN